MLVSVENSHLNSWHLRKIVEVLAKTSKAYFGGNDDVTRRPAIPQSSTVNLPPIPRTNFQTNFGFPLGSKYRDSNVVVFLKRQTSMQNVFTSMSHLTQRNDHIKPKLQTV